MVIFLYNLHIFVLIQHFWVPPLNRVISQPSYNQSSYKDVPVYQLLMYVIGYSLPSCNNIGIKHGFSCINIRQVPWASGLFFQHLPRDLGNVNALKNLVRSLLLHKISKHLLKTFRVISCTILFRLFTDVSRTQFPRTMLGLVTHLVTAANLWPRYEHIESCVAVH